NDLHVAPPDDLFGKSLANALDKTERAPNELPDPVTILDASGTAMAAPKPRFAPVASASSLFALTRTNPEPLLISPAQPIDPTKSIETIAHNDQRFRGILTKCSDGVVSVEGSVKKWADLWEFAEKVSRLPGVERVRIEKLRLDE